MLATLYNTVARNEEWLSYAKHGVDFLNNHCFDTDGRMFFTLTREGNPSVNAVTSFPRSSLSSRWPPMARRPGTTATYNRP
jgi:mannose/cellobiose epimerase-like protein (N-acyl-D-glucosamine 2-epimerase family)